MVRPAARGRSPVVKEHRAAERRVQSKQRTKQRGLPRAVLPAFQNSAAVTTTFTNYRKQIVARILV
jgi:hypothetical protein